MSEFFDIVVGQIFAIAGLREFMEMGGYVLGILMLTGLVLWTLLVERYWYMGIGLRADIKRVRAVWEARGEHHSWHAHKVRDRLVAQIQENTSRSLPLIKTLIAIAPLMGLLGTVTGMVEVFDVMAVTGASNARAMAAGVSKATLPTMAGMVVSLSGMYLSAVLDRWAERAVRLTKDEVLVLEGGES
jgi:biopolymer transport protein ExbB